jgi:hypothetical protein
MPASIEWKGFRKIKCPSGEAASGCPSDKPTRALRDVKYQAARDIKGRDIGLPRYQASTVRSRGLDLRPTGATDLVDAVDDRAADSSEDGKTDRRTLRNGESS